MKTAVILFHKNIERYPADWVKVCLESIRNQTYIHYHVFELDYGGANNQIFNGSRFMSKSMADHAHALNFLLDHVFDLGYDCAFNVNVDDFYASDRFAKQIRYMKDGYDIVSSNFHIVDERGQIMQSIQVNDLDMEHEAFQNNHNIIAHPAVCYSKRFKEKLISSEIPRDDFELWKRCYHMRKYRFAILPDYLLYYRVHNSKVS